MIYVTMINLNSYIPKIPTHKSLNHESISIKLR